MLDVRVKHNLAGRRFGRLTVVAHHKEKYKELKWVCKCDCGGEIKALAINLLGGRTKSCGCLRREHAEITAERNRRNATHRRLPKEVYKSWRAMHDRCLNPNHIHYDKYGGRGIKICDRWLNSFEAFRDDMGPRPPGTSLERIDNDGDYEPGNCRWATQVEQSRNTSRVRVLEAFGRKQCLAAWAEEFNLSKDTIARRLRRGWPLEEILNGPQLSRELAFRSGRKLAEWMKANGYNDRAFAEKVGCAPSMISKYRKGHRIPNRFTFANIQEVTKGEITRADFYASSPEDATAGRSFDRNDRRKRYCNQSNSLIQSPD